MDTILKTLETSVRGGSTGKEARDAFNQLLGLLKEHVENDTISQSFKLTPQTITTYIKIYQYYISSSNNNQPSSDNLAISSLRCLGYFIYSKFIVGHLLENQIKDISILLENTISTTKNKNICNFAVWCLTSQAFPNGPISTKLAKTYCNILETVPFGSPTIEREVLLSFTHIYAQNPQIFLPMAHKWIPLLFDKMLANSSTSGDVGKLSEEMIKRLILPAPPHELFAPEVYKELTQGLIQEIDVFISKLTSLNDKNELHCATIWGYFIYFLGEELFSNSIINKILKLPEKWFVCLENPELRCQTFISWRYLIDALRQKSLVIPKRLNLIATPLSLGLKRETNSNVKLNCFITWLYLLNALGGDLPNTFHIVASPIITFLIEDNDFGLDCLNLLSIILLKESKMRETIFKSYQIAIEPFQDSFISSQWINQNFGLLQKVLLTSLEKTKDVLIEIWQGLLDRVSEICNKESSDNGNIQQLIQNILKTFEGIANRIIMEEQCQNSLNIQYLQTVLQFLIRSIPRSILFSIDYSQKSKQKQLTPFDFIMSNLLDIGINVKDKELKTTIKTILNDSIQFSCSNSPDLLLKIVSALDIINIEENNQIDSIDFILQFWILNATIIFNSFEKSQFMSSHMINQKSLTSLRMVLVYPFKMLDSLKVSSETILDLKKCWKNLFESFYRVFSIKTSLIVCLDQIIENISTTRWQLNLDFCLDTIVSVLQLMDFNSTTTTKNKSSDDIFTKYSDTFRFLNTILIELNWVNYELNQSIGGNVKSIITILNQIFEKKVNGQSKQLFGLLEIFNPSFNLYMKSPPKDISKEAKSSIALVKNAFNKLWSDILNSATTIVKNEGYNDDLLAKFNDLLVNAFQSRQQSIMDSTLSFWNQTFGQSPNYKLNYTPTLHSILNGLKEKVDIKIPLSSSDFNHNQQQKPDINATLESLDTCTFQDKSNLPITNNFVKNQKPNVQNDQKVTKRKKMDGGRPSIVTSTSPIKNDDHDTTIPEIDIDLPPVKSSLSTSTPPGSSKTAPASPDDEMMVIQNRVAQANSSNMDIKSLLLNITRLNFEEYSTNSLLEFQGLALLISNEINGTLLQRNDKLK
ncbi:hypothetical protein DFA_08738 [Cavenderia fasciculata]|uniref:Telomere-associated protein Rif1 N-terminal domain-containing protein n=1 Tax=Cavenderia fasciculata TaxID=261658 RepID=F4Q3Y3_CACFS|nr:uncharacterized protein DFA_08738 [Cavenderia fasciculata]EGG17739.1 hypothetical protein DFA_08738 [Cavenderia fasciculata]|eukprot:XP_004356223.1 hypothetical protein DFA_08738 [Cavenderia fasciculata]